MTKEFVKLSAVIVRMSSGLFAPLLCFCLGGTNWTLGGGALPLLSGSPCFLSIVDHSHLIKVVSKKDLTV